MKLSDKPTRIGAYDIVDVIGRGGMGTVYRGNDPRIGRAVAIKVLTAAADDPDLLIRFYREAKYTGNLHHQNIVTVYELGHQEGVPYLVMEYLEGISIEAMIASGRPMPIPEKLGIILQVCQGLTYAHQHGIVHRDIKPANIVVVNGGIAKIVDFGIALLGGSTLTRTGHVVGSLSYMSPEQLSGNEVDARTDVYSTAVVLFQMLTGKLPFDGGSTAASLKKILQDPPPPLTQLMADCPPELQITLNKALAKNCRDRYPSADEFALDLSRVQRQYDRKVLADTLEQAAQALQRKDFSSARHLVMQVLRAAPQNVEASDLLRHIKNGQEQLEREQQIVQLQMRAEEAFRRNDLKEAVQLVEQGLQLDPSGTVFPGLRHAIGDAQQKMGHYRESLKRAEEALRAGQLESAKQYVMEAHEILPDEPAARTLAQHIILRLEQQLQGQRAPEPQRQFALFVNAVEKAMADGRMQLFLGQPAAALRALEAVRTQVAQLPPRWVEQFEALEKEARSAQAEQQPPLSQKSPQPLSEPAAEEPIDETAEIPASWEAQKPSSSRTAPLMDVHSGSRKGSTDEIPAPVYDPPTRPDAGSWQTEADEQLEAEWHQETATPPASPIYADPPAAVPYPAHDVLYPRFKVPAEPGRAEVAPELREFLQPAEPDTSRSKIWLGFAVFVVLGVVLWLVLRPKVQAATYAEINAEPWATVTALSPASGDAASVIGHATPMRVNLPPGRYTVTLQGPNHQNRQLDLTVPQQGGASCFAIFAKPDVNRIVGK